MFSKIGENWEVGSAFGRIFFPIFFSRALLEVMRKRACALFVTMMVSLYVIFFLSWNWIELEHNLIRMRKEDFFFGGEGVVEHILKCEGLLCNIVFVREYKISPNGVQRNYRQKLKNKRYDTRNRKNVKIYPHLSFHTLTHFSV